MRGHVRQFTILGDGAAWIWSIAMEKFPEATQIVDLFQAREHLHDLARVLEFMLGDQREDWLAARLDYLGYGGISGSDPAACSSAPVPWKPGARRSSGSASNSQACVGPPPAGAIATLRCQQASRPED